MIRVLFVTYDFPYPLTSGGKNRAFNLIKYSKDRDISIDLLSFTRPGFEQKHLSELQKLGVGSIETFERRKLKSGTTLTRNLVSNNSIFKTLYFDDKFHKKLVQVIKEKRIDIVHFESSYTGFYIGAELRKMGVKQVLGTENIEYLLYEEFLKQSKNFFKKRVFKLQLERFKKEEEKMMRDSDLTIAVTEEEALYIENITGRKSVVIENAIDSSKFSFKKPKRPNNILFVGNFSYLPNIEALKYLVKEVLPIIDEEIKLTVIGRKAREMVGENPRIIVHEFVDNLIGEYRKAAVFVFPVKIGGGTNFKILEAMSLGIPIVAFSERLKGLGAIEGKHYISVKNAMDFKNAVESVLNGKKKTEEIIKNARELIEQNYTWEKVGRKLSIEWKKLYEKN